MSKSSIESGNLFDSAPDWPTVFAAAVLGASIVFASGRIQESARFHAEHHARTSSVVSDRGAPCRELSPVPAAMAPAAMAQVFVPAEVAATPKAETISAAPAVLAKPAVLQLAPIRFRTPRRANVTVAKPHADHAAPPLDDPGF